MAKPIEIQLSGYIEQASGRALAESGRVTVLWREVGTTRWSRAHFSARREGNEWTLIENREIRRGRLTERDRRQQKYQNLADALKAALEAAMALSLRLATKGDVQ